MHRPEKMNVPRASDANRMHPPLLSIASSLSTRSHVLTRSLMIGVPESKHGADTNGVPRSLPTRGNPIKRQNPRLHRQSNRRGKCSRIRTPTTNIIPSCQCAWQACDGRLAELVTARRRRRRRSLRYCYSSILAFHSNTHLIGASFYD